MNRSGLSDEQTRELAGLLDDLINREISESGMARLSALMKDDPAARHAYLEAVSFEAALAGEFPRLDVQVPTPANERAGGWWMGVAAALLGLLGLPFILSDERAETLPDGEAITSSEEVAEDLWGDSPVAVVSGMIGATLMFDGHHANEGDQIRGGRVSLTEGSVELTFHSGAVMQVVAPAELDLESAFRTYLFNGKATVMVPKQAHGFVLCTPTAFIRERGTRYVVEVLGDLKTRLSVLSGRVDASLSSPHGGLGKSRMIREGEAVSFGGKNVRKAQFQEGELDFTHAFKRRALPNYFHWSLDEWDGSRLVGDEGDFRLEFTENGAFAEPALIPGKFGNALQLDGESHYVVSDYPGVGGGAARSVAFWVRVQPGASRETPNGIVAWGTPERSKKWQVAWNADKNLGKLGAVRVEFGEGFVVGSTDLRVGKWHHVAVVFLGGAKADVSTHVRIYVDGVLEDLTHRKQSVGQAVIDTEVGSAKSETLTIGKYLGRWKDHDPFYFVGDVDEVFIFEGALQPRQIVRLMEDNRPE